MLALARSAFVDVSQIFQDKWIKASSMHMCWNSQVEKRISDKLGRKQIDGKISLLLAAGSGKLPASYLAKKR